MDDGNRNGHSANGNSPALRFGVFDVDLRTQELRKYGTRVKLPRQSFQVLQMLLEHPGTLVTREELQKVLWPADTFVDFDHGLNNAVKRIRTAIGDSAETPYWIETLPRLGYRFIGPVEAAKNGRTPERVPVAFELAPPLSSLPGPFSAADKNRQYPWMWISVSAVLLVAVLSLGAHYRALRQALSGDGLNLIPFTSYPGREFSPSFSPDGNQIAFSWTGAEDSELFDLYVKVVGTDTPVQLTHNPAIMLTSAWSPDGRFIAFERVKLTSAVESGVFLIPAVGGPERKLTGVEFGKSMYKGGIAWAPDSKSVIYAEPRSEFESQLASINIDSLQRGLIAKPSPRCLAVQTPAFSPNGQLFAYACMFDFGLAGLFVQPWPSGRPRELLEVKADFEGLAWAADGRSLVYTVDRNLWRIALHGGSPQRLWFGQDAYGASIARTGARLAFSHELTAADIWRIPLTKARGARDQATRLVPTELVQQNAQYSPDGKRLAFESNRSGNSEVWVCDADGSNLLRLTDFGGPLTGTPRWSPDGSQIVLDSRASGKPELYIVNSNGGTPRLLRTTDSGASVPYWSHDGKWIYFSADVQNVSQIFKVPSAGGTAIQITRHSGFVPKEVPDGRRLYYLRVGGPIEMWSIGTDGSDDARVQGLPQFTWPAWDVTQRGIYYYDAMPANRSISFLDFATKRTHSVVQTPGRPASFVGNLSVSPDETNLLYTQLGHSTADIVLVEGFR